LTEAELAPASLVLYRGAAARVSRVGSKKLTIELDGGQSLSVRPKDVTLLHPGPLADLAEFSSQPSGEPGVAWELLAGSTTTLAELSELAYGEFSPITAWAAWQLVADGLYFSGTPQLVTAHTTAEVAEQKAARAARAAEEQAWLAFTERVAAGRHQLEDERYLLDLVALALAQRDQSQVLRALGQAETPEKAHALLLRVGFWDETVNPYPARAGLETSQPGGALGHLPAEERLDLTHLEALAIDDEGATDPDDAISLDGDRLWVHVADVAALAPPDSPADLAARARAANLYLPEGTVHMLPEAATTVLALGLGEFSPALSFGIDLDEQGHTLGVHIVLSLVKVRRLSYEEAEELLDEPLLAGLLRRSEQLARRRQANGAIDIQLPEVKVRIEDGQVLIRPLIPLRSRQLVQEAMLLAGRAVADFAARHHVPLPYTVQEPPAEPPRPAQTLSEMLALVRTMRPGQQSSAPGPHAGLGLPHYVQVTSPLRRYLDLVAHQQLRAFLRGEEPLDGQAVVERVGAAEAVRRQVRWAERRSIEHWTLVYLQRYPEWQGQGVVIDRRGSHDVVLIPELNLETRVYGRREVPLDTEVGLRLIGVNLAEREAFFHYA
jgi:exoribonuclease II